MSSGNKQKILTKKNLNHLYFFCLYDNWIGSELLNFWRAVVRARLPQMKSRFLWLWQCSPTLRISFHGLMVTTTLPSCLNFVTRSVKKLPSSRVTDNTHNNLSPKNQGCTLNQVKTFVHACIKINMDLFSFCYYLCVTDHSLISELSLLSYLNCPAAPGPCWWSKRLHRCHYVVGFSAESICSRMQLFGFS